GTARGFSAGISSTLPWNPAGRYSAAGRCGGRLRGCGGRAGWGGAAVFWREAGVPVDLREAVTGLDENNAVLAAAAVLRAAGFGICAWPRGVSGGEHGHRCHADPAAAPLRGPVTAGAGQHAPARRGRTAGGAARWQQAADPGGVD